MPLQEDGKQRGPSWQWNSLSLRHAFEAYKGTSYRGLILEKSIGDSKIITHLAKRVLLYYSDCLVMEDGQPVAYRILDYGMLSFSMFDYEGSDSLVRHYLTWVLLRYQTLPVIEVSVAGQDWRSDGEEGLLKLVNDNLGSDGSRPQVSVTETGRKPEYALNFLRFLTRECRWVAMLIEDDD